MSKTDAALVEVDNLCEEILEGVAQHGGTATSTQVRKLLGIDSTTRFNYRIREKLVPEGLVETRQPDPSPGEFPPKEITLTDHGKDYLESLDSQGRFGDDLAARLERLEEQVDSLRQENRELREENEELKAVIEQSNVEQIIGRVRELTDDVDSLQARVSDWEGTLGDLQSDPVIENETARKNINTGLILGNALRELAVEEYGEDRVMDLVSEKQEKFGEEGELI